MRFWGPVKVDMHVGDHYHIAIYHVTSGFCSYFFSFELSKLTSLLGELGLNIQEAHAFSTNDGYSLDVFVVVGWKYEVSSLFLCIEDNSILHSAWKFSLHQLVDSFWMYITLFLHRKLISSKKLWRKKFTGLRFLTDIWNIYRFFHLGYYLQSTMLQVYILVFTFCSRNQPWGITTNCL